ncbi:hypothetical protein TNCV_488651 [Trichonephila clavipes]|nr:hypothetical protein TNCV_488651 [Trichonephila clavipes]
MSNLKCPPVGEVRRGGCHLRCHPRYLTMVQEYEVTHPRYFCNAGQKMKLPVRLINTTNERRLVQGLETPLSVKRDIEDVSSELDNGD